VSVTQEVCKDLEKEDRSCTEPMGIDRSETNDTSASLVTFRHHAERRDKTRVRTVPLHPQSPIRPRVTMLVQGPHFIRQLSFVTSCHYCAVDRKWHLTLVRIMTQ
jgi:hypothetical protein